MNTEFKIFTSDYGFYVLEDDIKEYQEKHNMEIESVILIKNSDDEVIIGVVFKRKTWKEKYNENKWVN